VSFAAGIEADAAVVQDFARLMVEHRGSAIDTSADI
jgi:hypothetical protein